MLSKSPNSAGLSIIEVWSRLTPQQQVLAYALLAVLTSIGVMRLSPLLLSKLGAAFRRFGFSSLLGRGSRARAEIRVGGLRLSDEARMRHTHIIGATGSGKTVMMEHLIYRDLARGYGALIIDPKGERDLYDRIKSYCKKIGRLQDLHLLSATHMEESARWNPCRLGSPSELQSKFYCSAKYEHSFFAKAAELSLLRAFESGTQKHADVLLLGDLVEELDTQSSGGRDENLKGLYFDIQNLAQGEWSPVLCMAEKPGNQTEVSLLDITRKNEILFVDLPTEGKSVQSSRVGSLLLQEVTLLSGIRKRMPAVRSDRPFGIFVDEFDAFATEPFVSFLNKGRSSDFMITVAHQTLSDLDKVSPTFKGQVMGNFNIFLVFRINTADDAEHIAKLFGTRRAIKRTHQTDGNEVSGKGSQREVQEFRIHPDSIKELSTGTCVASIKTSRFLELISVPMLDFSRLTYPKVPIHGDLATARKTVLRPSLSDVEETYSGLIAELEGPLPKKTTSQPRRLPGRKKESS